MPKVRGLVVVALVIAMAASACGSSKKPAALETTTTALTPTTQAPLTASFRGVTATTIKIGVAIVDYDCIKQFVDFNHGPQQAVEQAFINDLNSHGGILGRQIVPVYKTYCPIAPSVALDACTSLTEDSQVFAVLGVFAPTSPDAQLCLSRDHQTILIGHELQQATISQAPPGLLLTPDITDERRVNVLMGLLKSQGTLTGHKVGILADQDSDKPVHSVVIPDLQALGIQTGTEGVLTINGNPDTSAAQTQLDSFIEKWKSEHVDTLFMAGLNVTSKQFVEKIKARIPNMQLMTDGESGAHDAAQGEVTAKKVPNPYEGMISANGQDAETTWNSASVQHCAQIYEATIGGQQVPGPNEVKPGPDGHTAQTYQAVEDFCSELTLFKLIATKAGPDLTNTTWTAAVNSMGSLNLVGSVYASLHTGKYDADDGFRLVSFDSSIQPQGDWKGLSPILNAASS